ncbi:MAG: glycerophosphodiester phosphodiesterase family protein, partial [Bacteroidota bacterium]
MRYALQLVFCVLLLTQCGTQEKGERIVSDLDIQGHRGARGILPENSIRGFLRAVDLGVTTLELDLCITSDRQVIVSHEPYMSHEICLDPNRSMISEDTAKSLNIYHMTYEEVQQYDCGSLMHGRFPSQGKVKAIKPLLGQVFSRVEEYLSGQGLRTVNYNIELKSNPEYDNLYHPEPKEFSDLVFKEIDSKVDWSRVTIQSFDPRILQYFRQEYPEVTLSLLIENENSWQQNVEDLGFKPDVYSCYYKLLTADIIS